MTMALEFLEEAYYSLEDRIGQKGIIGLAIVIVAVIAIILVFATGSVSLKKMELSLVDSAGNGVEGARLKYTIGENTQEVVSDSLGNVSFSVPLGSEVDIFVPQQTVAGTEFEELTDFFTVEEDIYEEIVLTETRIEDRERTIIFKGENGARIEGKAITVRLSCANGYTVSPSIVSDSDKDGIIKAMQPHACDVLTAIVTGPSEYLQATAVLENATNIIELESSNSDTPANEVPKGNLKARVKNNSGDLITDTSFSVTIRKPDGSLADKKETLGFSEAFFSGLTAGTYKISVEDDSGDYGIASASGIVVYKNQTTETTIVVSKNIKRTIEVVVKDSETKQRIPNAVVELLSSEGDIVAEHNTGSNAEDASFSISTEDDFSLLVEHPDYYYETLELGPSDNIVTVELELIQPEVLNKGAIKVRVIDEYGKPVEGAKVALRNAEDDFLETTYRISDFNGIVWFKGLKSEITYYAYASKEPVAFANNKDYASKINSEAPIEFVVELIVGNAVLKLETIDEDLDLVYDSEASIYTSAGELLGKIPMPSGTGEYEIKADKSIYIVFSHADYASVQTMPVQLWPEEEFEFKAVLPRKYAGGEISAEHAGIYNKFDEKTTTFEAGEKYTAKFRLIVPENLSLKKAGLHFRVGDDKYFENANLEILSGIVGNASSIVKGLRFSPPNNYEEDSQNLTEGNAKWINMEISSPDSGVYEFGIKFRVKKTVLPHALLTMHYRAYAVDSSNNYLRYPFDNELGISENTGEKQALYAQTIDNLRFFEGDAPDCGEEFCYSGQRIFDNEEELWMNEPFEGLVHADYNVLFRITNNSERAYGNSELFIKNYYEGETNEEIKFEKYVVKDAQGSTLSASGLNSDKIEKIDLGNFFKGTSVSGNVLFRGNRTGPGLIYLYVVADGSIVFEKIIDFTVNSNKAMTITVEPEVIPAFIENNLTVKVTYEKEYDTLEIEDALVKLTKTNPDKSETVWTAKTNALGIAEFSVPASSPGTKLLFEAQKVGYYAEPVEKEIVSAILLFDPASISSELDTRDVKEQYFDEKITNLTGIDLQLASIRVEGKLKRVLDIQTMTNYSSNFTGTRIMALDTSEIENLLFVKLKAEAARLIAQNTSMDGNFWITVADIDTGNKYDFELPLKVGITIAELPEEPCISISTGEWKASTQGNRATLEFEVQNNCVSDDIELELENLMARVLWSSNQIGTVELTLTDSASSETSTETLRSLQWTKMFDRVRPFTTYSGFLTFTPKQEHLGEEALFAVEIDGQMLTAGGLKFVGSVPEAINSQIKIINLEQCLQFGEAEDILKMSSDEQEIVFTIDSSECGNTPMEIALCREDSGKCSGGAEGGIQLSKAEFSLSPDSPSQEITVFRQNIPGMYGIVVEAKIPGRAWQKVTTLDLLIEPGPQALFYLDRYAFVIKGIGSSDSATLSNDNVTEHVTVDASATDWAESWRNRDKDEDGSGGGLNPAAMALPAMMGVLPPLIDAMSNAGGGITKPKENQIAKQLPKAADEAKKKAEEVRDDIDDLNDKIKEINAKNGLLKEDEKTLEELLEKAEEYKTAAYGLPGLPGNSYACAPNATQIKTQLEKLKQSAGNAENGIKNAGIKYQECALADNSSQQKAAENAATAAEKMEKSVVSANTPMQIYRQGKEESKGFFAEANNPIGIGSGPITSRDAIQKEKMINGAEKIADGYNEAGEKLREAQKALDSARKDLEEVQKKLSNKEQAKQGVNEELDNFKKCLDLAKEASGLSFGKELAAAQTHSKGIATEDVPKLLGWLNSSIASCSASTSEAQWAKNKLIALKSAIQNSGLADKYGELDNEIKELQKKLADLETEVNDIQDNVGEINDTIGNKSDPHPDSLYGKLNNAQNEVDRAIQNKQDLANFAQPIQDVKQKAPTDPRLGEAMMNLANMAAMGAMMGALDGGCNDDGDDTDPTNDRVQQEMTAWVINLKDNAGTIAMDNPNIIGYWDPENWRLIGQFEKQEIGIIFENTGIEEPEPMYSTASVSAWQTLHPETVTLPDGILGGITNAMLGIAGSGFMGPSHIPGITDKVTQKFHLKFTTMDYVPELPPVIGEKTCLQGTMIGTTGEEALPQIKLSWDWDDTAGINSETCLENGEAKYCDATQFSIMLSKRLRKLQDFIESNHNMDCPENPGVEIIGEITQNYNQYLLELGLEPLPANLNELTTGCWMPKSTIDMGPLSGTGNKTALEYYVEEENVNWTDSVQSIEELRELLRFNVYLMKDGYGNDFRKDFADYYTKKSFLNAPQWFSSEAGGKWADYFYNNDNLEFTRKYLDSADLLAPGLYEVSVNIDFGEDWEFFSSNGQPGSKIIVVFNYLQEPYPNSVFYYLPFNADVGRNSSDGRLGYGLDYENENESFAISGAQQDVISTAIIPGSVGITRLVTETEKDVKKLNSLASNRGMLLKIVQEDEQTKRLVFSPNYATPVTLRMSSEIMADPFYAFYELHEARTPMQTGGNLTFWSAAGQCYDFTGMPLSDRFDFTPDRQASSSDPVNNWQYAYGIDWDKAEKSGDVYLRTIFYTPAGKSFALTATYPTELEFATSDSAFIDTVDLKGISGMLHNNQAAGATINSLKEIFSMVESEEVCITNTGSEALFWWNPETVYSAQGTAGSQKQLNESIECISG